MLPQPLHLSDGIIKNYVGKFTAIIMLKTPTISLGFSFRLTKNYVGKSSDTGYYSLILVEKKADVACRHIHTGTVSIWRYVKGVEKNEYLTLKQTPKTIATAKYNVFLSQTCGRIKTVSST